jgi:predicted GTPase
MSTADALELTTVLRECLDILRPFHALLPTWHEKIQTLLAEGAAERLRIGVVGVTSSGKSTFINALLGEEILPEQSKATTNLPVICRKGQTRKLKVVYPDKPARIYQDWDVSASLLASLCSEDGNPGNAKKIGRIELEMPSCCLHPDLEIIDTPGTDAYGLADHETVTLYRCLPISDIIVFMTHIRKAGLTVSEARLLECVIENDQRVLFVISSSDSIADEYQDGRLYRSRSEKVSNSIAALAKSIEDFPSLKEAGIVAVSSLWAKSALGDRTSSHWRTSNFEGVVKLFESCAADLDALLTASRIDRTRANLVALRQAVHTQSPELKTRSVQTKRENELTTKVAQLEVIEERLRQRFSGLRKSVAIAVEPREAFAEAAVDLATVHSSDLLGLRRIMSRIESRWEEGTERLWAQVDEVRVACRKELESLRLTPGREGLRNRALHLNDFPNLATSIVKRTETYEVPVPRSYFGGKLVDWFLGTRTERRSRTTETVDMASLRRALEAYMTTSSQQILALIDEQLGMFAELYLEPIRKVREVDGKCLNEFRVFRSLAAEQAQQIPEIERKLRQLEKRSVFSRHAERQAQPSAPQVAALRSTPEPAPQAPVDIAATALYQILTRAWESVALRKFWEFAAGATRSGNTLSHLLWVGQESWRFAELTSYLNREMTRCGENTLTKKPANTVVLMREKERIKVTCSAADEASSLVGFAELCAQASAIAVDFDATQLASGINRLLADPRFKILQGHAGKVFFLFMDGAVFNARLQDLVSEVIPLVAKATGFTARPWFVCEAVQYDARYSDFIRLADLVRRSGGSARDLLRRWREERLSLRPPFQAASLEQAFTALLSLS